MGASECLLHRFCQVIWNVIFKKKKNRLLPMTPLRKTLTENQRQRQPLDTELRDDRYSFILKQDTFLTGWLYLD